MITVSREIIVVEHEFTNSPNVPIFDERVCREQNAKESKEESRRKRHYSNLIAREGQALLDQEFHHTAKPSNSAPRLSDDVRGPFH